MDTTHEMLERRLAKYIYSVLSACYHPTIHHLNADTYSSGPFQRRLAVEEPPVKIQVGDEVQASWITNGVRKTGTIFLKDVLRTI